MMTTPLLVEDPFPLNTDTLPPEFIVDKPADNTTSPPVPHTPDPTVT